MYPSGDLQTQRTLPSSNPNASMVKSSQIESTLVHQLMNSSESTFEYFEDIRHSTHWSESSLGDYNEQDSAIHEQEEQPKPKPALQSPPATSNYYTVRDNTDRQSELLRDLYSNPNAEELPRARYSTDSSSFEYFYDVSQSDHWSESTLAYYNDQGLATHEQRQHTPLPPPPPPQIPFPSSSPSQPPCNERKDEHHEPCAEIERLRDKLRKAEGKMPTQSVYNGAQRRLVLAFDIGTTHSGISYSVLEPGQVPEIKGVTRFPNHERIDDASKIPNIIYYDRSGNLQAVGANTRTEGIYEQAEEELWVKAEWFKHHLKSKVGAETGTELSDVIPFLPPNMTEVEVFADFLAYLLQCASYHICEMYANGVDLWASVEGQIDFVLSYPNVWGAAEQSKIREAALLADLIPNTAVGHARLWFVAEGEARLHFAIQNGLPVTAMKNGNRVMVVGAEEGTIDISSYSRSIATSEETFHEVAATEIHFCGSIFVSIHARRFLETYLSESPFADDIDHIVRRFDETTKLRFRNAEEGVYIKFGTPRDNDASYNIHFGQLKLLGKDVALFFKNSIDCIVKAVMDQKQAAHNTISHVVLVGSFAASDYLFNMVRAALAPAGLTVLRPENHVHRAVSDGAISFYLGHFMRSRVSQLKNTRADLSSIGNLNELLSTTTQGLETYGVRDRNEIPITTANVSENSRSQLSVSSIERNSRLRDQIKPSFSSSSNATSDKANEERHKLFVENQRLRDELKSLRHSNFEISQERVRHMEKAIALRNELENVKREAEGYRALSAIREKELLEAHQDCARELQRIQNELKRVEDENRALRNINRDIYQDRICAGENATTLVNELSDVKGELDNFHTPPETYDNELIDTRVLLTTNLQFSALELNQKVDLEHENLQAAAWFSKSLVHAPLRWKLNEESQAAYQVARIAISDPVVRILGKSASEVEPRPNPLLAQFVAQTVGLGGGLRADEGAGLDSIDGLD